MKRIVLFISIVVLLSGCRQEELLDGNICHEGIGEEISFTAGHSDFGYDRALTKTIYGDREGNSYPIYWENEDQIGIYSPQASYPELYKQFNYKVLVDDDKSSSGRLAKINPGENGLTWGESDEHDFYAIYPASAAKGGQNANQIIASIPLTQRPTSIEIDEEGNYIAYPDMDYAYMYAHTQVLHSEIGSNPITLNFKPIVTVLEITVNGPTADVVVPYQVSQVSIRSSENLTGDFLLTVADSPDDPDDGVCTPVPNGTVSNLLTIPTYYNDKPVELKHGQKLVVKAFMLPYASPEKTTTTVTVNIVGQGSRTKVLNTADIESRKINITSLPALTPTDDIYYWTSALDKSTFFSQLSVPGSHNSYSIGSNVRGSDSESMGVYQTLSIEDQFKAGARAFSFMVGFGRDDAMDAIKVRQGSIVSSSSTGWNDDYPLYVYNGAEQGETLTSALDVYSQVLENALNHYSEIVEGRNCLEFIVLIINFKQTVGGEYRHQELKRWIKELNRILENYNSGNSIGLIPNISATTTVEDVRGKIITFVNYQEADLPDKEGAVEPWGWMGGEEYEGFTFNPQTDVSKYVFCRKAFDVNGADIMTRLYGSESPNVSAMNDRDIDFPYYMIPEGPGSDVTIWRQHLERLNNPVLGDDDNYAPYRGRIDTKINITKDFFMQAVENNTAEGNSGLNNWYVNNLGGFCVASSSDSYSPDQGESGNTVRAANLVNGPVYDYLQEHNDGPTGIVLMNFFGEKTLSDSHSGTLDVYGEWLPQVIIENNYRFALKKDPAQQADMDGYSGYAGKDGFIE